MANPELTRAQRMELLQCIRMGIYRAEQDLKAQTSLVVQERHREELEIRRELLRIFEPTPGRRGT